MNIQANTPYSITNAQGGTCLDLSGGDNMSIIGYGYHSGPNQAWVFQPSDDRTYSLKAAASNRYVAAAGEPSDGQRVIATDAPYPWCVENDNSVAGGLRLLSARNPNYCLDLADHGNATPGTAVQLWQRWEGKNQVWMTQVVQ